MILMKKAMVLVLIAFSLSMMLTLNNVQAVGDIDIVLITQSPYPAEPGKNVNVEIELQNNEYREQSDVTIELVEDEPFSLLPGEQAKKSFTRISSRSSVKALYNLKVSSSAPSNEYDLEFHLYTTTNPTSYVTKKVKINVEGEAKLVIDNVETIPINIEPGGTVDIIVDIKNVGTGDVTDLELSFDFVESTLVPILAKGSVYIGDLDAAQIAQVTFSMAVDTSAEYKTYTGTLTASYDDSSGVSQSSTFSIGIPVTGSIKIEVIKVEPLYDRNQLRIQIANKGTTEARALEAKLYVNGKLIDIYYISLLKANKQTTLNFPLVLRGDGELVLEYIGPNLEKVELRKELPLNFNDPRTFSMITSLIFWVIVIILFYFFIWKRHLKKHFVHKKHHHH